MPASLGPNGLETSVAACEAYERMKQGDVKYRFVIDLATLKAD